MHFLFPGQHAQQSSSHCHMNRANIISANNGLHLYGPLFDFHSQLAVSHISSAASLDLSDDDTHFIVAP